MQCHRSGKQSALNHPDCVFTLHTAAMQYCLLLFSSTARLKHVGPPYFSRGFKKDVGGSRHNKPHILGAVYGAKREFAAKHGPAPMTEEQVSTVTTPAGR